MESTEERATRRRRAFGDRIRAARKDRGWSQEKLAERAGVERKLIYRTELGTHSPRMDTAWKLSDALNLELVDLLMETS